MTLEARLEPNRLDPQRELAELLAVATDEGAVVSFVGIARRSDREGRAVDRLFLDHHPRLTEKSLQEIASEARGRFAVSHVRVVHRCGEVPAGEAIVFAGAAAEHRRAAFDAADYLMDRLKTDALFWKKEEGEGGSTWIEPTENDRADRARWSQKCPE